jgi:hypothetical protein
MSNPYAPPTHDSETAQVLHPPSADGSIIGTTTLTEADMAAGLSVANKVGQWFLPILFAFFGFAVSSSFGGVTATLVAVPVAVGLGWLLRKNIFRAGARRSLAGKSDRERTLTWRFTPETFEITTSTTYTRMQWSAVHRSVEGKDTFAIYTSEAIVQIIPKRAFRAEDLEPLRGMLARCITPRKRPSTFGRIFILWFALILLFLAIWQFLQGDQVRPHP